MNTTIWKLFIFCLSLQILTTNTSGYDDYKMHYRIKIVDNNDYSNPLMSGCMVTSIPKDYDVPKEEFDILYTDLAIRNGTTFCGGPQTFIGNPKAILIRGPVGCGLIQQIRNARASNITFLVITSNKKYLPYIKNELDQFPIVVLMPLAEFNEMGKHHFNDPKIGIYGSIGNNIISQILITAMMFGLVIFTFVLIIIVTIVFNDEYMKQLAGMTTLEMKQIKWQLLTGTFLMVGLLLLMFYFYNVMVWIMIILFYFLAAFSIMTLAMLFFWKYNWLPHWVYPVNKCGVRVVDYRMLCLFAVGLAIATAWILNRHNGAGQILNNILGIFLCVYVAVTFGKSLVVSKNFKPLLIFMALILVYDVVMVFTPVNKTNITSIDQVDAYKIENSTTRHKKSTGESIMETVATGGRGGSNETIPMTFKISFDLNYDLSTSYCQYYQTQSILGYGDIALPGFFIVYIVTYAVMTTKSVVLYSLFTFFSYIVGLVVTYIVLWLTGRGQPALLYLLPCLVIPTLLLTVIKKDFMALWNHSWFSNQTNVLVDGTDVQMLPSDGDNKILL